jgi:RNA polymerase sigma-70 factor (ECF subfamily)
MDPSTAAVVGAEPEGGPSAKGLGEFEQIYRRHVSGVTDYFARRSSEPQIVADLTSETLERAANAWCDFDRSKASARAWLFGLAVQVDARHRSEPVSAAQATAVPAASRSLSGNEVRELAAKIDAQRDSRDVLRRCARLPGLELDAVDLVDLAGLAPDEAAAALGVYPSELLGQLSRARTRLLEEREAG